MAQVDYLRRYAKTVPTELISALVYSSSDLLEPATAISRLGEDAYTYISTSLLKLTLQYEGVLIPLGNGYFNDVLWVTDTLLIGQSERSFTTYGVAQRVAVWALADSKGGVIYIPVREDYYHIIKSYLPHITSWQGSKVETYYPLTQNWLEGNLDSWPEVYELVTEGIEHPYAKGMKLTGFFILQGDGIPVYEYLDTSGCLGQVGTRYLTSLRAPGLDFPLGQPKEGDLIKDLCVGEIGWYPSFGYSYWVGKYTGYRTSYSYHPLQVYYLYERLDGSVFLIEAKPDPNAWVWVESALGGGMVISLEPATSETLIEEFSCGVEFLLEDASLIPPGYQYPYSQEDIGDCVTLDDLYLVRGGKRTWLYVDDLLPVKDNTILADRIICNSI